MTTQTKALKLAHEGVEIHSPNSPEYIVCAALIEALAQPEQEPVAWAILTRWKGVKDGDVWSDWLFNPLAAYSTKKRAEEELEPNNYFNEFVIVPLYTTPPQRKPLTDEQERKAFEQHWYDYYHCGSISPRTNGTYIHPAVQKAWEAWQARAAHDIKA